MWICGGRAFQVEGSASTKALRQEYLQCVLKQYLPLDWRKREWRGDWQEMGSENDQGPDRTGPSYRCGFARREVGAKACFKQREMR